MLKKGQAPPAYYAGALEPYNFKNLSKEQMREITRKSAEARRRKRDEKMALQKSLKGLLSMDITNKKQKQILREMGIKDADLQNGMLLMVALMMKGIKGDVGAIKEIVNMMDRLDILEDSGKITQGVNINLVSVGNEEKVSKKKKGKQQEEQEEDDIWDIDVNESDSEWGEDVF